MSIIQDIWKQEFSLLLISGDKSSKDWLQDRLNTAAQSWAVDSIIEVGKTLPKPIEKYNLALMDSINPIDDILAVCALIREAHSELPIVLLVSRSDIAESFDTGPVAADAILFRGKDAGEDDTQVDLFLRYTIGRKRGWVGGADQINFDPVTGFPRADRLAEVIDLAIRQAKYSQSFVALLSLAVSWLDESNSPVDGDNHLWTLFVQRLTEVRRRSDFVCIDENGNIHLVLVKLHTSHEIDIAASRILNRLLEPFFESDSVVKFARIEAGISHTLAGQNDAQAMVAQANAGLIKSSRAMEAE